MKQKIGLFLMILVLGLMGCSKSTKQKIAQIVADNNKGCPRYIDESKNLRLDKVELIEEKKVRFNYTLVNDSKEDLGDLEKYTKNRPALLNEIKKSDSYKDFRDNELSMVYAYNDKNGVFLFQIEISSSDYKN